MAICLNVETKKRLSTAVRMVASGSDRNGLILANNQTLEEHYKTRTDGGNHDYPETRTHTGATHQQLASGEIGKLKQN